jgi:hypothetical protein
VLPSKLRRGQHDALDALAVGIGTKKVNWVLDADIRGFFDAIDHGWLVKFVTGLALAMLEVATHADLYERKYFGGIDRA